MPEEEKKIQCPMMMSNNELVDWWCVKEKCAWWDEVPKGGCAILGISKSAYWLAEIRHRRDT